MFAQPIKRTTRSALLQAASLVAVAAASLAQAGTAVVHAVNSGGSAAGAFSADAYFSGGTPFSSGNTINTGGVSNPAPQTVYQTERFGAFTYTFPGLSPSISYIVRLHFAEIYHSSVGARKFNVLINGASSLSNYDIYAAAGAKDKAVVEEFAITPTGAGTIAIQFTAVTDQPKVSGIEILDPTAPDPVFCLNADFDKGSVYTGVGAAPDTGTTWNVLGVSSQATPLTWSNLSTSLGVSTSCGLTLTSSGGSVRSWSADTPGNPSPLNLMKDYLYGNTYTVSLSGLPEKNYFLYVYAHGDQANQNSTVTVNAANGGGSGTTSTTGTEFRNIFTTGAMGYSYLRFPVSVGAAGSLTFTSASYLNGFQLMEFPKPNITVQPPATPTVSVNNAITVSVTAVGEGTLTYQWRKGGVNLTNGASGNGSSFSGVTSSSLVINNAQYADTGNYDVLVTNPGGTVTSNASSLSVTSDAQAPAFATQPANQTVLAGGSASFNVVANGTYPLTYVWHKDGNPVSNGTTAHDSVISGTGTANLSISNAQLADAGSYHVVVSNGVGSDASTAATLTVNHAPSILTQPSGATVATGQEHTLTSTFGPSFPAATYQWQVSSDGLAWANVSGGNATTLTLTGSPATSGFYRVTGSNSVGSVISSVVHFGIPSTQPVVFAPGNNATNISIDQQLRLVFPSAPKLGLGGALRIHDAADNSVVATIDRSQFVGYTLFGVTVINALKQTVQGKQMYYLPIAIYGNEAWVTLGVNQRLSYGKTYYVTMDAGLFMDSNNAEVSAITSPTAWRFSTKASGPAAPTSSTGPTMLTVGMDGTGDFATIQGAADWVPQNNTLRRNILVKPGIYRDIAYFGTGRNFITLSGDGTTREAVQLHHQCAAEVYGTGARGMGALRIDSNDVNVRDLTLDNGAYVAQPNLAGAFASPAPAFAGPINTVATTGQRLVFDNILMKGGQDTLYTISGSAYFHKSEIWGSVDFIYGDALAVFDQCDIVQIRNTGGPICAPSTPYLQPYGEVFLNCRFPRALVANGYPYDVGVATTTFMRPWRQDGMTAIINCQLDTHFSTKGWGEWSGSENPCRAREFGSTMIGGGAAATPAQRQAAGAYWLNTLDPDYTTSSMSGTDPLLVHPTGTANRVPVTLDPNDYTLSAIFGNAYFNLNGWMPSIAPRFTTLPTSQSVNAGGTVTFTAAASGDPAPVYQWFKNGTPLDGETNASLVVSDISADAAGSYTVTATNAGGSSISTAATLTVNSDPYTSWINGYGLDPQTTGAPGEDFDHDGLTNRQEFFFFGGNPTSGDLATVLPTAARSTSGPAALVYQFKRATTASAVPWTVEYTGNLNGTWTTATHGVGGVTINITHVEAGYDLITVNIPATDSRIFARTRVD